MALLKVRPLIHEDIPRLMEWHNTHHVGFDPKAREQLLLQTLENPGEDSRINIYNIQNYWCHIAEIDGDIIGLIDGCNHFSYARIINFFTPKNFRKEIGQALINSVRDTELSNLRAQLVYFVPENSFENMASLKEFYFQTDGELHANDINGDLYYAMSYSVAPLGMRDIPKMIYRLTEMSSPYEWMVTDEFGKAAKNLKSGSLQNVFFHTSDKIPHPQKALGVIRDFLEIKTAPIDCPPEPDYIIIPVDWFKKYHMAKQARVLDFHP